MKIVINDPTRGFSSCSIQFRHKSVHPCVYNPITFITWPASTEFDATGMSSTEEKSNPRKLRSQIYSKVKNGREALRIEPLDSDTDDDHSSAVRGRIKANSQHANSSHHAQAGSSKNKSKNLVVTSAPLPRGGGKVKTVSEKETDKDAPIYLQDVTDEADDFENSNSSVDLPVLTTSSSPNDSPNLERKPFVQLDDFSLPKGEFIKSSCSRL